MIPFRSGNNRALPLRYVSWENWLFRKAEKTFFSLKKVKMAGKGPVFG
jgi:hypothetical protein